VVVSAFREDVADIPIYRPESIAVGDRITHVNGLRVRTVGHFSCSPFFLSTIAFPWFLTYDYGI
jgi:hypothetical protein